MGLIYPHEVMNESIDLFINGDIGYKSTGIKCVDKYWQIRKGENTFITGYPTSGKSVFLRNIRRNLTEMYEWRHLVYGPEEGDIKRQILKIALNHLKLNRFSYQRLPDHDKVAKDLKAMIPTLSQCYLFLNYDGGMPSFEELKADCLEAKKRFNYQTLTIDPWSYLKFPKKGENFQYMEDALADLNIFIKAQDIHCFVIAHPKKPTPGANGKNPAPTAYDIAGSSEWFNKGDNIISLHREGELTKFIKLKTKDTGMTGECVLRFDTKTGIYEDANDISHLPKNINGKTGDWIDPNDQAPF